MSGHEFSIEVIYTVVLYGAIMFLGTRKTANRLMDKFTRLIG